LYPPDESASIAAYQSAASSQRRIEIASPEHSQVSCATIGDGIDHPAVPVTCTTDLKHARWHAVNAPHLVALDRNGATFKHGTTTSSLGRSPSCRRT
jgi:hypothetical protein